MRFLNGIDPVDKMMNNLSFLFVFMTLTSGFASKTALASGTPGFPGSQPVVKAILTNSGTRQDLGLWSPSDSRHFKRVTTQEKDPQNGKLAKWDGVLISKLLDKVIGNLPLESRAQIDLVVLSSRSGKTAYIPRALITKYPMMLAATGDSVHSVVPWTSSPRILKEGLPLDSFYLSEVTQVELTNYKEKFKSYLLKRRTDPSAMRGEKLFVQNCMNCHANTMSDVISHPLRLDPHPTGFFTSKLTDRDRKSLSRYAEAHRSENPVTVSEAAIRQTRITKQ